mgnify:FL=1
MKNIIGNVLMSFAILGWIKAEIVFPYDGVTLNYTHIMFRWTQEPDCNLYNLVVINSSNDTTMDIHTSRTMYIDQTNFNWGQGYVAMLTPIYENENSAQTIDTISFNIGPAYTFADLNIEIINTEDIQDGLALFSQVSPNFRMVAIDKLGNQVWNSEFAYINHWNEYGQLFGMKDGRGVEVNFYDEILWMTPEGTEIDAHEIKQIPNGNYMGITTEYQLGPIPIGPWTESYQNLGYVADGYTNEFTWRGTKITEWDSQSREAIWDWNPFEHFSTDDYDSLEGRWWSPINGSSYGMIFDWNHVNAFHFDEEESMVYISNRNLSRITKVSYPDYNLIWNMGPPSDFGYGDNNICTDLLFSCQHHIQLLDDGDLLFFDNGKLSEIFLNDQYPTSRIRRIRVEDDAYCETIWEYELPQELYGHSWGSVQLLDNGNYFIYTHGSGYQDGSICTLLEVSPEKEIVWRASQTIPLAVWYRGYKIPSIHPDAFSVNVERFKTVLIDSTISEGIIVDENNQSIIFTIYNHSGYNQPYLYSLTSDNESLIYSADTVYIASGDSYVVSTPVDELQGINSTALVLNIKPLYHKWASLDLTFDVFYISGILNNSKKSNLPTSLRVFQNYPNPFNPNTMIKYDLVKDLHVRITIYDLLGNTIKNLFEGNQLSGSNSIQWDGTNNNGYGVSSGTYVYQIKADNIIYTGKMVLIK